MPNFEPKNCAVVIFGQPFSKVQDVFLSLQKVMESIMRAGGKNTYHIPHQGKDKLRKEVDGLPTNITCDEEAINMALYHLDG